LSANCFRAPIIIILALLAVLELAPSHQSSRSVSFLIAYLILSILVVLIEDFFRNAIGTCRWSAIF